MIALEKMGVFKKITHQDHEFIYEINKFEKLVLRSNLKLIPFEIKELSKVEKSNIKLKLALNEKNIPYY